MRIAVIGSGIGGLAAGWLLGRDHEVTLYEAQETPGMGAQGVEVGGQRLDVPQRVFYEGYYPTLIALYRAAKVEIVPVEYSVSFTTLEGETYYRYHNQALGPRTLAAFLGPKALRPTSRRINRDLLRYYFQAPRDLRRNGVPGETISQYLVRRRYSPEFVERFLIPSFAGIGTCTYEQVRDYPAEVLNEYMSRGFFLSGVLRAEWGTEDVVERLLKPVTEKRCGCPVVKLEQDGHQVLIRDGLGGVDRYDHAIVSTQANQALRFLEATPEEGAALSGFTYAPSRVVMHTDQGFLPRARSDWAPVNFVVSPDHPSPMATIWMNSIQPGLSAQEEILQTWNPFRDPDPETVISSAAFERPVVDGASQRALEALDRLHHEPGRRIWFCGSYAQRGIPLLESAAASAMRVASALGLEAPWPA